jgi:CubicO group peptidase (beta-lactamase class C family)
MLKWTGLFLVLLGIASCKSKNSKGSNNEQVLINSIEKQEIPKTKANEITQAAQTFFTDYLMKSGFEGGFLIAYKGNILYENYYSPNGDINAQTPIHIASCSKTFTAYLIASLYQQGKLNLTDTLQKFFPQFPYQGIRIIDLLTHRSGLPKYEYAIPEKEWPKDSMVTNVAMINALSSLKVPAYAKPNANFSYGNINYLLLAAIAEQVTNTSFPQLLKKQLFEPLGMTNSFVFTPADSLKVLKSKEFNGRPFNFNFLDAIYGDKNVYTTVTDLFKWHNFIQHHSPLRKSLMDSIQTGYSWEKPGIKNYGLGWRLFYLPNNKKVVYHNGWWHGNNCVFMRLPQEDAVIIATGNKFTRSSYAAMSLSGLFGDYLGFEEDTTKAKDKMIENQVEKDSLLDNFKSKYFNKKTRDSSPKKDTLPKPKTKAVVNLPKQKIEDPSPKN